MSEPYRDDFLKYCLGARMRTYLDQRCRYCQNMTIELDGRRWKPVPGATATAEEFIAARSLIHEIHQQARWSPWVMQDRAASYDAALKTLEHWTCTDPSLPGKTLEEYEAELQQRLAETDARFLAAEAQAEQDRAERAKHYDRDRAEVRLA
jgi:hypothetical protein